MIYAALHKALHEISLLVLFHSDALITTFNSVCQYTHNEIPEAKTRRINQTLYN